ncbi:von Willebrand factor type A domain-containing protein [Poronia punctata]|nr:von Willebrand factor type A domain-containing protein [Poronia punctata]
MARTKQTARSLTDYCSPQVGCWHPVDDSDNSACRHYLPMSAVQVHTVIKDVASRTTITQSFTNTTSEHLENMVYSFPGFSGIAIVSFSATIGDVKITGVVKEKREARREFEQAVAQNKAAALMEQLPQASDVFTTHIGNVPAGSSVVVELTYVAELNYDAEYDGIRLMIPSSVAPRFGDYDPPNFLITSGNALVLDGMHISIDVETPEGFPIHAIQSPSHEITLNLGRTTSMPLETSLPHRASATLSLKPVTLDKDFVAIVKIANGNAPKALLETHATIPKQRALMVTLVPKFDLPPKPSEVVFVLDRSGSMRGKMQLVTQAMTTMLKSLRVGIKFNICSFGDHFSFLWPHSSPYNEETLEEALKHVENLDSNYGGTRILEPVQATLSQRFSDLPLNVILLTDGQIWNQDQLFKAIREASQNDRARFFALGIGHGTSTALVEGIAAEGKGISQFVTNGETMDKKMVRLLKCALMPHVEDICLDVKYRRDDEEYEIIEAEEASKVTVTLPVRQKPEGALRPVLSFFDKDMRDETEEEKTDGDKNDGDRSDRFAYLPAVSGPAVLQAPFRLPPLYPVSRSTTYLLLDPSTFCSTPESVIFRASSNGVPIELEIQVDDVGKGETVHALAAKKAVSELDKGHGWLSGAVDREAGVALKTKYPSLWDEMVQREAVRLGLQYQIAGKWCSYIAVEGNKLYETTKYTGRAPRRQLASKACRRSVPSSSRPKRQRRRRAPLGESPRRSPRLQAKAKAQEASLGSPTVPSNTHPIEAKRTMTEPCVTVLAAVENSTVAQLSITERMYTLIRLQRFDGSWEWQQSLLDIAGVTDSNGQLPIQPNAIGATTLAVAFFRTRAALEVGSWELVAEKAVDWLAAQNVNGEAEIKTISELLVSI